MGKIKLFDDGRRQGDDDDKLSFPPNHLWKKNFRGGKGEASPRLIDELI